MKMGVSIRVRVAKPSEYLLKGLSQKERRYYKKQARMVANILNHRIIQSLLKEVIESEDISLDDLKDVRVMILPSMRDWEYGDHLFGSYDPKERRISIYPAVKYKGSKFLSDPLVSFQFIREAFDTVVHEVLHVRYSQERFVKRLTRKYLKRFYQMLGEYFD